MVNSNNLYGSTLYGNPLYGGGSTAFSTPIGSNVVNCPPTRIAAAFRENDRVRLQDVTRVRTARSCGE